MSTYRTRTTRRIRRLPTATRVPLYLGLWRSVKLTEKAAA